jgi:hypothetical protein
MQILWTTTTVSDQLGHLEQVHRSLLPLQDIFCKWQHTDANVRSEALAMRERLLARAHHERMGNTIDSAVPGPGAENGLS